MYTYIETSTNNSDCADTRPHVRSGGADATNNSSANND